MKALRILLAEDDAMISFLLAEIIENSGHQICAIETTEAGVVRGAAHHRPDMLIVDAHLGSGSGVVAVAAVLRVSFIPYLLISGGPIKGAQAGAVILEKPFFDTDLFAAIERAVAAHASPAASLGALELR
jgi:DNA-binding response OmpR family regulator